jgi:hypothetical protein
VPVKNKSRKNDPAFGWVKQKFPQLEAWRTLATTWLMVQLGAPHGQLFALEIFFERYLIQQNLPLDPEVLLSRDIELPDFFRTACADSKIGVKCNNYIHDFLEFVLLRECSDEADDCRRVVHPRFHNPVRRIIPLKPIRRTTPLRPMRPTRHERYANMTQEEAIAQRMREKAGLSFRNTEANRTLTECDLDK